MRKCNGYVLLDSLVAGTILLFLLYTIIPMTSLLLKEREVLSERRLIASMLHDDLQLVLSNSNQQLPYSYVKSFNTKEVYYQYQTHENELVEGCVRWENIKKRNEKVCLYGLFQN